VLELLVLGMTLSLVAWAAGAQAHRRGAAARALDRYAQSRGLRFTPAPTMPRGASPRVHGTKDGIDYEVDLYRLRTEMRTRVSAVVARGHAPVLSVAQHGAFAWNKPPVLVLGDAAFDQAYLVTTGAADGADALRTALRSLLRLDEREGVWLRSDGSSVAVSWRGLEADPQLLDAARDAVVTLARCHTPAKPYR
jgi:hypothetical protein